MTIRSGLYIHWPFCRSKCPYCDFFSKVEKNVPQDALVDAYLDDIKYYAELADVKTLGSVFFGGGTPSLLSPYNIGRILEQVAACWQLEKGAEISLEANPNTDRPGLFADLRKVGINRLSLGIQSLEPEGLKFLGRTHSAADALKAAEEVLILFDNTSADIIYARPTQSSAAWQRELEELCSFGFKHLSLYQLTIEEGTPFARKGIKAADDETAAQLYDLSRDILAQHGYLQYEVSNYAKPGYECRHNKLYWQGDDYIGVGNGAHGRLHIGGEIFATTHPRKLEKLSSLERAEELVLMGLRLNQGIDKAHFEECCGQNWDHLMDSKVIAHLVQEGLVEDLPHCLRPTSGGLLVLNAVIAELVNNAMIVGDN